MASTNSLYQAVWETADKYLRGVVPRQSYGDYILPFTVLRRMECILEPHKEEMLNTAKSYSEMPTHIFDAMMKSTHGLPFYSTSPLDLSKITDDHVKKSLQKYLNSFNSSVRSVWKAFKFDDLMKTLDDAGVLWGVINHFSTLNLHDKQLANGDSAETAMGNLFEDLMFRSFSENGQTAGEYYTPREVIRLMVDILFNSDDEGLTGEAPARTVYDPACGTGGMLIVAKNAIEELNPSAEVSLFGQEMMSESFALGRSDLIVTGNDPDNIKQGNTLTQDHYAESKFDYVLSNPPYGSDWKRFQTSVVKESAKVDSRFSHGLPSTSDGQMLFLCHVVDKLKDAEPGTTKGGRAGVVTNGSPLFTGSAESGSDLIRHWLIESDYIDAIIALPMHMFYNTGIATYVWILDKNKPKHRQGKIQLINAADIWTPMKKGMGDKRRMFSVEDMETINKLYDGFENNEQSRIVTADDLGFLDIPMMRPSHFSTSITEETVAHAMRHKQALTAHEAVIRSCESVAWNDLPEHLKTQAKAHGVKIGAGLIDHIMNAVAIEDSNAPIAVNRKGETVMDKNSKIVERVPLTEDVDEHMQREVLPFAPDMMWDISEAKKGYEIPMTRLFYKPEVSESLEELDKLIEQKLESIRVHFAEVKEQ